MSMLRFEMDKKVGFREYMRSDGTRSYFFSLGTVRDLFLGAGFIEVQMRGLIISCYCHYTYLSNKLEIRFFYPI